MKTKLLSSLLLSALIALPVAGAQADDSYPLRMGNITSNDAQEAMGQKFIDLIRENSDGKIDGRLYSSASLGSNDEVMRGLQLGSIQANINPTGYLTQFVPQAGVLALPWIFPGDDAGEMIENITRVMRGEAAQEIKKLAAERGFHIVSFFGIGPNQIFLNPDVTGIDDLDGKRIRTIAGKEHTQTVNDWGARAIHMSLPEIYTSVQQGVLDGFDLPADVTLRVKYHEHARNVLMTNHVGLVQYIAVSKRWYDGLPDDLKKVVDDAGREVESIGTVAYVEAQTDALKTLAEDSRINLIELSEADRDSLRELNRQGIWAETEADSVKGPVLKMLLNDVEKLAR